MQLKLLKLSNCLGIEEKEIKIGKITLIDGESESGKTSIIDSIRKGLKNEDVRPKFVNGEGTGTVFMQFDEDLEVTRTVKPDNKSSLKITQNGMVPKSPQSFLNDMFGENDFAPIEWLKKKDKEQTEDLLKLIDIKVSSEDIEKLSGEVPKIDYSKHGLVVCEEAEKYFMEARKQVNSDVKAYKINIEESERELPAEYDDEKYRNIKLNELFEKITKIENTNNMIEKANERIANANSNIENFKTDFDERLKDLIAEFAKRKEELIRNHDDKTKAENDKVEAAKKYLSENVVTETQQFRDEAKEIENGQGYLRTFDKLSEYKNEFKKLSDEAERLTIVISNVRALPAKLLASAKAPIEGMGIEDGNITINSLPIKNLSDGAKMRLAIKIAKATSKELKLILLNGFEQLNWSIQKEMFKEMQDDEYQYIITRVTDGELSISHIKDGFITNIETGETINL